MRSVPEDSAAGRTYSEAVLGQIDIGWHSFEYAFLIGVFQHRIAIQTAAEPCEVFELEFTNNLFELLFVGITLD
jgi:hypothetical protein